LLKSPDHLLYTMMIGRENSTDSVEGRSIYIGRSHGVRRPREDLSADVCPHNEVKVPDRGAVAFEKHLGPNDSLEQTKEADPRMTRGRPACLGYSPAKRRSLLQKMRRIRV
jgi:hypothetical protein